MRRIYKAASAAVLVGMLCASIAGAADTKFAWNRPGAKGRLTYRDLDISGSTSTGRFYSVTISNSFINAGTFYSPGNAVFGGTVSVTGTLTCVKGFVCSGVSTNAGNAYFQGNITGDNDTIVSGVSNITQVAGATATLRTASRRLPTRSPESMRSSRVICISLPGLMPRASGWLSRPKGFISFRNQQASMAVFAASRTRLPGRAMTS